MRAARKGPFATQDQRRRHGSSIRGSPSPRTARVTAYTGKCELGQGIYTAQTQLVAEELSVPLARVTLIQCDTVGRAGSGDDVRQPVDADELQRGQPGAGRRDGARGARCVSAPTRLGVPADQLTVVDGVIGVQADRVAAGQLRRARRREEVQPRRSDATREAEDAASAWTRPRHAGAARVDMAAMATGAVRVRAQRARARHAARARRAAAGGRRDARRASTKARSATCRAS